MSRRSLVATSVLLLTLTLPGCRDDSSPLTDPAGTTSIPGADPALVSNGWSSRANMPSDRWYVATATFPDRIGGASLYAIGGSNGNTPYDAPLGKVQVYNPATNTWATKASLPHVVAGFGSNGAQVIDSLLYVPGGQRHVTSVAFLQVYNPATNTWVDKAPMPPIPPYGLAGLGYGVSGAISGKLYVLGSCLQSGEECGKAFERYDPRTDTWTLLPLAPFVPSGTAAAGVLNKKLYVEDRGALEVYDPATNRWALKAQMPSPRIDAAAAAVNNKLYVIGGFNGTTQVGRVDVYDPATNTWTQKASIPRIEPGLSGGRVVVNGQARLEVVGGARPGNNLQYIP